MTSHRFFFFDTETGGLDPNTHSLLTLAYTVCDYNDKTRKFKQLIPYREMVIQEPIAYRNFSEYALQVNNINPEAHYKDETGLTPREALEFILEDVKALFRYSDKYGYFATVAGHNVHFDIGYMKRLFRLANEEVALESEAYNYEGVFNHRPFDTCSTIRFLDMAGIVSLPKADLDAAIAYFNITLPEVLRHTAAGDIGATVEVAQALIDCLAEYLPLDDLVVTPKLEEEVTTL